MFDRNGNDADRQVDRLSVVTCGMGKTEGAIYGAGGRGPPRKAGLYIITFPAHSPLPPIDKIILVAFHLKNSQAHLHPTSAVVKDLQWVDLLLTVLRRLTALSYTEPEEIGWWGDAGTSYGIGAAIGKSWAIWRWAPEFQPGPGSQSNARWAEALAISLGLLMLLQLGNQVLRRSNPNHILIPSENMGGSPHTKRGRSRPSETNKSPKSIRLLTPSEFGLVLRGKRAVSEENVFDALSQEDVPGFLIGYPAALTKVSVPPPECLRNQLQSL